MSPFLGKIEVVAKAIQRSGFIILAAGISACSYEVPELRSSSAKTYSSLNSYIAGKFYLELYSANGSMVFSDHQPNSALVLRATENYRLVVETQGTPPGTQFVLRLTELSSLNGIQNEIPLQVGSNQISFSKQGDYALVLIAFAPSGLPVSKHYQAIVTCSQPTFTANSLNSSGLSVSSAQNNLYSFSIGNLLTGANGMPPYKCAWDPTGVLIRSTDFQECNPGLQDFYSSLVGVRSVGVLVKDACNTIHSVNKNLLLAYRLPSEPDFVYGKVTRVTGNAISDPRVAGVTYLATNPHERSVVRVEMGSHLFAIEGALKYAQASSVKYGVRIEIAGVSGSFNSSDFSGQFNLSNARVRQIVFSTDRDDDRAVQRTFSGSNCELRNQGSRVRIVSGGPCSAGMIGDNNKAIVEIFGDYACVGLDGSGAEIDLSGSFSGKQEHSHTCVQPAPTGTPVPSGTPSPTPDPGPIPGSTPGVDPGPILPIAL